MFPNIKAAHDKERQKFSLDFWSALKNFYKGENKPPFLLHSLYAMGSNFSYKEEGKTTHPVVFSVTQ